MAETLKDPAHQTSRFAETVLSFRERALHIEKCRWAREFAWEQLEAIARQMADIEIARDAVVFHEGDRDLYLCLLIKGQIGIWKEDSTRSRKRIATIDAGQTFGEMSLFDERPRSATAQADADCLLLVLRKDRFNCLVQDSPALALKLVVSLIKVMSSRLRKTTGQLAEYLPVEESGR